jgi:dihydrofolate synthase/folylpolyglutamate synthase
MTHLQAVEYLESLEPHRIRPGLDRIRALLARLGNPQREVPSALIGGTNGKGSVSAYLDSILREAGVGAGLYVSPHLVTFEERIRVAGEPIPAHDVTSLTSEIRAAVDDLVRAGEDRPTYFEATTALAFLYFRRRRVRLAVLEVGMGGRFDATNSVEPLAAAITPVAMDHMEWLGRSLPEIAHQKAGILRRGVPAVIGHQLPQVLEVLEREATKIGAPLTHTSDCDVRSAGGADHYADPPVVSIRTPSRRYDRLRLALRGSHQADNAAVAVLLAEDLRQVTFRSIDAAAIIRGLERAIWPGRIEIVRGDPDLLLDGAHNPAACGTLAAYIREHHAGRTISLVFAAMKDKPIAEMLDVLCPLASDVVVTGLPVARGESPAVLQELAGRRHPRVLRADRVDLALEIGRRAAGRDGLCVGSGSL